MSDSSKGFENRSSLSLTRGDQAIRLLLEATASVTGADFYRVLVNGACRGVGSERAELRVERNQKLHTMMEKALTQVIADGIDVIALGA